MWKGFCSSLPRISCPAWSRGRFSTITRPRPSPRLLARDVAQPLRTAVNENRRGGHRAFLGFFDPSARPYVESNVLSFTIPMSRFKDDVRDDAYVLASIRTHGRKIKARIDEG